MKYAFTLLMILLFSNFSQAQDGNYASDWEKVQQLEKEGLTKSALIVVEGIEKKAKKDDNSSQRIKTLFFKSKYALTLEEDAQLSIINDFKSEIAKSTFPTKNLLENVLAKSVLAIFSTKQMAIL